MTYRMGLMTYHYDAERLIKDFGCRKEGQNNTYRIAINIDNKSVEPFYISDCIAQEIPGGVGYASNFEQCPGAAGYELQRDTMECHILGRSYTLDPSTGQKTYTSGCRRWVGHSMQPACLAVDVDKMKWEHNDQDFYSLPFGPYGCKDEHHMTDQTGRDLGPRPTYGQIYHITEPMAIPGRSFWMYVLENEIIKPTGKIKYRGCKAFDIARKFKKFRRIDNSYYELATDEIVEQNERDVCDSITTEREFKTGYKCGGGTPIEDTFGTVLKTTRTNRENKAVIGEVCKFKTTYNERRQLSTEPNLPGCSDPHNPVEHQTLTVPPCPF
ncbi:MAG: hypothetical protein LBS95_00065 [Mycoplasmataceae bacterium]|nr:hypothetical protein [Mycoplasmataceae bacterium]